MRAARAEGRSDDPTDRATSEQRTARTPRPGEAIDPRRLFFRSCDEILRAAGGDRIDHDGDESSKCPEREIEHPMLKIPVARRCGKCTGSCVAHVIRTRHRP